MLQLTFSMFTPSGGCQRKKYYNISFYKELATAKNTIQVFFLPFSCLSCLGRKYGFRKTDSFLYCSEFQDIKKKKKG